MAGFNYPATSSGGEIQIPPNVQYVIGVDNVVVVHLPIGSNPSVTYTALTNTLTFYMAQGTSAEALASLTVEAITSLNGTDPVTVTSGTLAVDTLTSIGGANSVTVADIYTRINTAIYSAAQLDAGQLDTRYYTETEINAMIGTTIQGYDAGLAYLDGLNFTDEATFKAGVNLESGVDFEPYNANIQTHISSTSNPHSVTAAQVSALALAGGTMTGAITRVAETKVAMGANDIDLSAGNLFTKTFTATTFTLTVSNVLSTGNANSFILETTNAGLGTITWPTGTDWAGGTAPTLTSAGKDILGFYSHDGGTTWNGIVLGLDVK